MKCPRCNSENVRIESKEYKPKITLASCLTGAGFGLFFAGPIGLIVGALLGLLIAGLLHAVIPTAYHSVKVCQSCGFVDTKQTTMNGAASPLFCTQEASSLVVIRKSSSTGALCPLIVRVDDLQPFPLNDGDIKHIALGGGTHTVRYQQNRGLGRKNRQGLVQVEITEKKRLLQFRFLPNGLECEVI